MTDAERLAQRKKEAVDQFRNELNAIPQFMNESITTEWGDPMPLPMWGTLWTHDRIDADDVEKYGKKYEDAEKAVENGELNEDRLSLYQCGWRELGDTGVWAAVTDDAVILGIDGAGYDFVSEHWEPLYDLLGLTWHENRTEADQLRDALRDILPYAENELTALESHVRDVPEVQKEVDEAAPKIERARELLKY